MRMTFQGAAGDVTGSCHQIESDGRQLLVDCGLFQGSLHLNEENAEPFGFEAAAIEHLLLTHAHLDHCGRIPLLVKRGFKGRIWATAATQELAKLVLLDAAGLQKEDHVRHPGSPPPLYDTDDVLRAMALFAPPVKYGETVEIVSGARARFVNAGHILGSAWIELEMDEGGGRRRVVFSGDLGNRDKPILDPPAALPAGLDAVVMESTYGDRNHRSVAASVKEFQQAVQATLARGGNVVIPTFALERAQDLLYYLREMVEGGQIPASTQVFLDSPMAISATEIFQRHPECYNPAAEAVLASGHDPFALPGLHFTRETKASQALNGLHGVVLMAGSGMATGGRILHHFQHNLANPANSIVFVGFAAHGTVARRIIDGAKEVRLYGESTPVRAQIHTIGGFSAHADHDELMAWAQSGERPERVVLVHGEASAAAVLARDLEAKGMRVEQPQLHQSLVIGGA